MNDSRSHLAFDYFRDGDPVGERQFARLGALPLERGAELPDVVLAYQTWGRLNEAADNAVLVEHALTGDAHVCGPSGPGHPTRGWWDGLVGPGRALDTDRYLVVCANVLGGCQGSTGPSSRAPDGAAWGSRFPYLTVRDLVLAETRLADHLGIARFRAVVGGSMGGMRALEWAVGHGDRVELAVVLASTAHATADQIAWCQPQLLAIRHDVDFHGGDYYDQPRGPEVGLGIARRIAHVTYRSERELQDRFGRREQDDRSRLGGGGLFAVESYLDHHAGKIVGRFDPNSYLVLTEAMSSHDVGRGRGGLTTALREVRSRVVAASVSSDRLYPPRLSREIASTVPRGRVESIESPHGHDGFLIEVEQVADIVGRALDGG